MNMNVLRRKILYFTCLNFLIFVAIRATSATEEPDTVTPEAKLAGAELVSALQQGGYILYFRHGITGHSTYDTDRINLQNCHTQRLLSKEGREQMQHIGVVIKKLGFQIGSVYSSPYCRSIDTARLAFGDEVILEKDLRHTVNADENTSKLRAEALKKMLATLPKAGTNSVISGHTANLQEATGIWPKPEGVAVVFKPQAGAGFDYIATIAPDGWDKLLQQSKSQQ